MCNIFGRGMSGFEVIVGDLRGVLPGRRKQKKKPGLNSVKWVSVKRGLILPITQQ